MRRYSKGDVSWYLPNRKRPVAYSTKATADLINILAETCDTIQEVYEAINYDSEAKAILKIYIEKSYKKSKQKGKIMTKKLTKHYEIRNWDGRYGFQTGNCHFKTYDDAFEVWNRPQNKSKIICLVEVFRHFDENGNFIKEERYTTTDL